MTAPPKKKRKDADAMVAAADRIASGRWSVREGPAIAQLLRIGAENTVALADAIEENARLLQRLRATIYEEGTP